jgi:Right handed beta helix region/Bacterial TSP3 repeat
VPAASAKPADRDRDKMADRWERRHKLNPKSKRDAKRDPDRDRLENAAEFKAHTNPRRADTDRDGMRDGFEVKYKLNPRSKKDARRDPDHDGLTNRAEARARTNPRKADTDGDGMTDGYEVRHGFNPRRKDARPKAPVGGGGPSAADSDGDGYVDTSDQCPSTAAPGTITGCSTGTIRYISPSGVDAGSCMLASPCRTIAFADGLLTRGGDAIVARGGTYTGQSGISWGGASGTATARVALRNYPGETPVFEGAGTSSPFARVLAADHTIFEGLTVQNYKGISGLWLGYSGSGSNWASFDVIRNMTFRNSGNDSSHEHAIYLSYGIQDVVVENNRVFNTSGAGIHGYHGPGVQRGEIRNNIIIGANYGIIMRDGPRDVHIYNNVVGGIAAGGQECIGIRSGGQGEAGDLGNYNSVVSNNILFNCLGGQGISSAGATNATISHNLVFNTPRGTSGTSAIMADPLFVNPAGENYRLQSGSPAVDSGLAIGAPVFDADGLARPRGAGVDRGAYER